MNRYRVSVQIGFYSEPYQFFIVYAYSKEEALSKVSAALTKNCGHRFLNIVEPHE